ncbi:MAG: hypothetical protein M3343_05585 [Actinomycetota bacterium]|nr:hypothetical protein [Actinomycetota bacterium]
MDQRGDEYRGYWQAAARSLSAEFTSLDVDLWRVHLNGKTTTIHNHLVQADDPVVLHMAADKVYTHRVAQEVGLPTPPHLPFRLRHVAEAARFMSEHGGLFVVKPAAGSSAARGVTTNITGRRQLAVAASFASLFGERLLVEQMMPAEACRLLFLGGEFIDGVRRRGVRITGDGRLPIDRLLERNSLKRLASSSLTAATLTSQGLSLSSVPPAGKEIVVRSIPQAKHATRNLRTIYDERITDLISGDVIEEVTRLVQAVGSEFAGVDLLTNDPSVTLQESGGVFLEINTTPGVHHHCITPEDEVLNRPAVQVLRYLLERN